MDKLNDLLKKPWFQWNLKSQVITITTFAAGLFLHGVNITNKFASGKTTNKVK
jgi:hypothetical protein